MRQRDLAILLERVPSHPRPDPRLEQYRTPAPLAAEVMYRALSLGDIEGRRVLDLGCGTGMLAIAAAILGAESAGVDVDAAALAVARDAARDLGVDVALVEADVAHPLPLNVRFDTVVTNPPFGAQRRHADRPFLAAAARHADVVHSFHLSRTAAFVRDHIEDLGGTVTHAWDHTFALPHQFRFHERAVQRVDVTVVRWTTGGVEPYPWSRRR